MCCAMRSLGSIVWKDSPKPFALETAQSPDSTAAPCPDSSLSKFKLIAIIFTFNTAK